MANDIDALSRSANSLRFDFEADWLTLPKETPAAQPDSADEADTKDDDSDGQETPVDRLAVLDQVFADLGYDVNDLSDFGDF